MAGVAITSLRLLKLKTAGIPLTPIEQQDEISAEIEKPFYRLEEAVANLQRVKAYVFKAAVEARPTKPATSFCERH